MTYLRSMAPCHWSLRIWMKLGYFQYLLSITPLFLKYVSQKNCTIRTPRNLFCRTFRGTRTEFCARIMEFIILDV